MKKYIAVIACVVGISKAAFGLEGVCQHWHDVWRFTPGVLPTPATTLINAQAADIPEARVRIGALFPNDVQREMIVDARCTNTASEEGPGPAESGAAHPAGRPWGFASCWCRITYPQTGPWVYARHFPGGGTGTLGHISQTARCQTALTGWVTNTVNHNCAGACAECLRDGASGGCFRDILIDFR